MKIYFIDAENDAIGARQLLRLSADCASVRWSKFLENKPSNLIESLDVIETYVEEKLKEVCYSKDDPYILSEKDDKELFTSYKKSEVLKNTVGSGVILVSEFDIIREEIRQYPQLNFLIDAFCCKKNLLII